MSYFFSLADCHARELFPGVAARILAGERMMASVVDFEPGGIVEWHSHPHEQMGMLVSGTAEFFIGDDRRILEAGDLYRIPGNVRHRVVALGDEPARALDFFSPVREDYLPPAKA